MQRPHTIITSFSIFDQHGHLCSLDIDFAKINAKIYISGYLKPKHCKSTEIDEESVPVKDIGPILQWLAHFGGHFITMNQYWKA